MAMMILNWRARAAGRSMLLDLADVSNAFSLSARGGLRNTVAGLLRPRDRDLGQQRVERATVFVEGAFVRPGSGTLPGDPFAVQAFCADMSCALSRVAARAADELEDQSLAEATCPHEPGVAVDVSLVSYVDDVAKAHVGGCGFDAPALVSRSAAFHDILSQELGLRGYAL